MANNSEKKLKKQQEAVLAQLEEDETLKMIVSISQTYTAANTALLDIIYDLAKRVQELEK